MDNFAHWLLDALKADAQRSKSDRVRRIVLRSYEGSQLYRQQGVTDVVRRWRFEACAVTARPVYVPLSFDWSEEGIAIGGIWRRVQLAHIKLGASRAVWLFAYPRQRHEILLDAHTRCLTGLGRSVFQERSVPIRSAPSKAGNRPVHDDRSLDLRRPRLTTGCAGLGRRVRCTRSILIRRARVAQRGCWTRSAPEIPKGSPPRVCGGSANAGIVNSSLPRGPVPAFADSWAALAGRNR